MLRKASGARQLINTTEDVGGALHQHEIALLGLGVREYGAVPHLKGRAGQVALIGALRALHAFRAR